jgi:hypothetical protein
MDVKLVRGLSELTGGKFVFITDQSNFNQIISNLLLQSFQPCATELQIKIEGFEEINTVPKPIPPIFQNSSVSLMSHLSSNFENKPVQCKGFCENSEIEFQIQQQKIEDDYFDFFYSFYAFNAISDLQRILVVKQINDEDIIAIQNQIIQLSLQTGILSEFTSISSTKKYFPFFCSENPKVFRKHYISSLNLSTSPFSSSPVSSFQNSSSEFQGHLISSKDQQSQVSHKNFQINESEKNNQMKNKIQTIINLQQPAGFWNSPIHFFNFLIQNINLCIQIFHFALSVRMKRLKELNVQSLPLQSFEDFILEIKQIGR